MASFKTIVIGTCGSYVVLLLMMSLYQRLTEEGLGIPVFNHHPGKCRVIPGIECGSEDFAVTKDGLAFISNGLRIFPKCDYALHKGSLYLFDFNHPGANVSKLKIVSDKMNFDDLDPHGLSLWEDPSNSNTISVFLIDHGSADELVHIFEYDRDTPGVVFHKETIKDSLFVCVNDLVATGPQSFYITNFLAYCKVSKFALVLEFILRLKTGNVVHFDGKKGKIVASGFAMSNGVNLSPDGKYVFVAESSNKRILIYKRDTQTNNIAMVSEVLLMTAPDNIEIDKETGDMYIGAQRNYKLPFGNYNGTFVAATQVMRVHCSKDNWDTCKAEEVLSSDGVDFVSGSSVAHFHKGGLLIGTVYHRLAYCKDVPKP